MWSLKRNDTKELIYKTETDSQTEEEFVLTRGKEQLGTLGSMCAHCYLFKVDNQQGTLHMWQPGWEGSLEENGYMYMYG